MGYCGAVAVACVSAQHCPEAWGLDQIRKRRASIKNKMEMEISGAMSRRHVS